MRRAVLAHLVENGGHASAVSICAELGIRHRQSLAGHSQMLARGEYISVQMIGSGRSRKALLLITPKGSSAIRGEPINCLPQTMELSG